MGLETTCRARVTAADGSERSAQVRALLESQELILRGEPRVRIARTAIASVAVVDGTLHVRHAAGAIALELGDAAARWHARLTEPPKSVLDKLGVRPGATVSLLGAVDPALAAEIATRAASVTVGRAQPASDLILLAVERAADLGALPDAARALTPAGALWVVHPKGVREVNDQAIFAAARAAGLTYTKVASVSPTHTAEKLVRPKAARA